MESEFSKFEVKWLLSAPDINSRTSQEDFASRLEFRSPFMVRKKWDGQTFRAELEVDRIVYEVRGKTNINSKDDMEFYAEGKANFFETVLPSLVDVAKQIAGAMIIIFGAVFLILKQGPKTDLGQWLISKDITPFAAAIYALKWLLIINLIGGVIAIVWRISRLRITSKRAGEKVENWLGATEQHFRHQKTSDIPHNQSSVVEDNKEIYHAARAQPRTVIHSIMYVLGGIIVIGVIGAIFNHNSATSAAKCKVISVEVKPDVFVTNGEADAGFSVFATIANNGAEGQIEIKARLETSEGQFTREQNYTLSGNTSREFKFGFPEPTINATNVQGWVGCGPN